MKKIMIEDILPDLRRGRVAQRKNCPDVTIQLGKNGLWLFFDKDGDRIDLNDVDTFDSVFHCEWELLPETSKVADYLVYSHDEEEGCSMFPQNTFQMWFRRTYKIGQQPVGAILVPDSEREE
jgi:hypothetical protein